MRPPRGSYNTRAPNACLTRPVAFRHVTRNTCPEQCPMELGVIGLGRMGGAIARRLIAAAHPLKVYNRTRSRAEALKTEGAVIADSPAECKLRRGRDHHAGRRPR